MADLVGQRRDIDLSRSYSMRQSFHTPPLRPAVWDQQTVSVYMLHFIGPRNRILYGRGTRYHLSMQPRSCWLGFLSKR